MFTASLAAKTYAAGEMLDRQQSALRGLAKAFAAWRLRRRQRAELYGLSDCTLKDIGICRTEIEAIVRSPERDAGGRVRRA